MVKNILVKKIFSALIIMIVAITLVTGCSGNSQHKSIITYDAQNRSLSAEQVNAAGDIIKERFEAIDYDHVTVTQDEDKKLKVEVTGAELNREQAELVGKPDEITILGPDQSVIITSRDIIDAVSQQDPKTKENFILIKFSPEARDRFASATAKYQGKPIAICLDDEIISAPVVQTVITDGQAQITGNLDAMAASELAAIIKDSHPLPCIFKVTDLSQE